MTMRRLCSLLVLVAIALVAAASVPAANHTQQGLETPPLWDPDEVMTVVLDGMLGPQPAAQAIRVRARSAGLKPIPSLGTESVARFLGLRVNHPAAQDNLEVLPNQPATRAEAAYSLAHALAVTDWQKQQMMNAAS